MYIFSTISFEKSVMFVERKDKTKQNYSSITRKKMTEMSAGDLTDCDSMLVPFFLARARGVSRRGRWNRLPAYSGSVSKTSEQTNEQYIINMYTTTISLRCIMFF